MDLCRFNVMKFSSDWLSAMVSLGITTQGVLDSASVVVGDLHRQYLIQFTALSDLPFSRRCFQLRRPFSRLVGAVSNCADAVRLETAPTGVD